MKVDLEDLGFRYLYPMRYRVLEKALRRSKGSQRQIVRKISEELGRALADEGIAGDVIGREKHLYSIYRKMSEKKRTLSDVVDVYGFRIIVDDVTSCYQVLGLVHGLYKPMKPLAARFPKATVVGLDLAFEMLAGQPRSWFRRPALVQADALALPFADASFDVVYANLSLSFIDDLPRAVAEVARILRPEGLFVFACLGPDSFGELRAAWADIDDTAHVANFPDMLGREMDRVERVFLHGDAPLDTLFLEAEHEGLVALGETSLAEFLASKRPAGSPRNGYYLIDPLGNLVLYFPPDIEPRDMVTDLKRLLRLSRIG